MGKKEEIFNNINSYSNDIYSLVKELVKVNINTYDAFEAAADEYKVYVDRYIKNRLESNFAQMVEDVMDEIVVDGELGNNNVEKLAAYIRQIQTDEEVNDVDLEIYKKIIKCIEDGEIGVVDLLSAIRSDNNFVSSYVVKKLLTSEVITKCDLTSAGIDSDFIGCLQNDEPQLKFFKPDKLGSVSLHSCTEFYFWGIPSSGKTCALGAILSAANTDKVASTIIKEKCQGLDYMNKLSGLFKTYDNGKRHIGTMPPGTPVASTYEMGFTLVDDSGYHHRITFIDLAGELLRCMYKSRIGKELNNQDQEALNTLTDLLVNNKSGNRKRHFFVIEYGGEEREYDGYPQKVYLDAAVRYIEEKGIFDEMTDDIYILITKVDKIKVSREESVDVLKKYLEGEAYGSFVNGLKHICEVNEIKCAGRGERKIGNWLKKKLGLNGIKSARKEGRKIDVIPFTLGKVCFQDYCKFDDTDAQEIVKRLLQTPGYDPKMEKYKNMLSS